MANKKFSQLTSAVSLTDTDIIPIVDGTGTKKIAASAVKTYAISGLSTVATSGSYNDLTDKPAMPVDITFNGSKLSSPATNSGDFPNGVITLAPGNGSDSNYADNGQFINIYPTNAYDAPHIHIAPGSGNNSTGSLILGNDNYHIDINNNGSIYVKTNNQNYSWEFDTNGNLRLPSGGDIKDSSGNSVLGGAIALTDLSVGEPGIPSSYGDFSYDNTTGVFTFTPPDLTGYQLASSAFSGDYNDLTNKPTIPTDVNELSDASGLLTATAEPKFDIKSTAFTASSNTRYGVDTTIGAITAVLPASPGLGDAVFFADAGGAFVTNNLTIDRNGNTINGAAADITVNVNGDSVGLFWNGTTWRLYE